MATELGLEVGAVLSCGMVFSFIVSTRCLGLTIICIRVMLRNRIRHGVALVKNNSWFYAPLAFVYGFINEPKYWQKHCEYMQKRLDYERKRKSCIEQ